MQIYANCKHDFEATKALTHLSMYRKMDPKKGFALRVVVLAFALAVYLLDMILFGLDTVVILLSILVVLLGFKYFFKHFRYPKIQYRSMANLKNVCNEYIFTDERLIVTSNNSEYNCKAEIAYSIFVKAYETSRYLFLFQTKHQAFVIDKSTLTGGTIEEIKNKLCLNQKYIICKY